MRFAGGCLARHSINNIADSFAVASSVRFLNHVLLPIRPRYSATIPKLLKESGRTQSKTESIHAVYFDAL